MARISLTYIRGFSVKFFKIEQFWPFEEISIFSNSGHLEWRAGLSDTILKWTHPARFGLIWFSELLSQYQPNFAEMILGWPPSKFVSVDPDFQPRWPPS
jgi:hypothetical protein